MRAFNHQHYVGSLRTKQGEFDAVESLADDVRNRFTPLWEVQPNDTTEDGVPIEAPLDKVVDALPNKIHVASKGLEGFVDCRLLHPSRRRSSGEHPLQWLCSEASALGTLLTPVVTLESDADYLDAAIATHSKLRTNVAVRIDITELGNVPDIQALIANLGFRYEELCLIVDCEHLVETVALLLPTLLPPLMNAVIGLGTWKSVTLLSGAIPVDYSALTPGLSLLPRLEWPLWLSMVAVGTLAHRPAFGDYGIAHPVYRYTPWWMRGAAKIRYTALNEYYIFRGQSLSIPRYGGYTQFPTLAAQVVANPVYRGPAYSAGDKYIDDCATGCSGPGNLQNWVEVGTSQHVTYVARLVPAVP